ncbi:MAG: hypothetical protein AAFO17_09935 [Pseudomonadota bacterium]
MNDDQSQKMNTNKKPLMLGYTVKTTNRQSKAYWNKIAAAWAHGDGEGYEVRMDALPIDGRLVLRSIPEDQPETMELFESDQA